MNPTMLEEDDTQVDESLLRELDKGLDDIEAGRVLSLEDGYGYVMKKRAEKRNARLSSVGIAGSV